MPDWEALREAGRAIKESSLRELGRHLAELEKSVTRAGGHVHWARDGAEANRIICQLVKAQQVDEVVKVKSITTDETGLNGALEAEGIHAVETDLAELIIQLAGEQSSHFLVPAIHKNRSEIRDLFREKLGWRDLTDDPAELAEAARLHLRRKFLSAEVGISGANFAVAETGTVGVVESEGNGRMCLTLPRVLITLMGIEKVIPTWEDLEVFLQLLPRSATGERMNPYTSLWTGVAEGDGPQEFHLVLLDNGRTRVLADPVGREALYCIRCSACLNVCPVYSRVGGHAYNAVYPGPIGSILMPQLLGPGVHDSLPYASSLCGACGEVCPVKIRIPELLLHLRGRAVRSVQEEGGVLARLGGEPLAMKALAWILASPRRYEWAQRWGRRLQWLFMGQGRIRHLRGMGRGWTTGRDLRPIPRPTFREWWRNERGDRLMEHADRSGGDEP
jgi:L-lactate dehydrogenase complex protein LldF